MRKWPKLSDKRGSTTPRRLKKRFLSGNAIQGSTMKAVWLLSEPSLGAIWGMSDNLPKRHAPDIPFLNAADNIRTQSPNLLSKMTKFSHPEHIRQKGTSVFTFPRLALPCLSLGAMVIGTVLFLSQSALAQPVYWVEVCTRSGDTLNLRDQPGTHGNIIAQLENGTPLWVLEESGYRPNAWQYVELAEEVQANLYGQVAGYIHSNFIQGDMCPTLHNPDAANSPGSRLYGRDVTLGAWYEGHVMHILNDGHPQSQRVLNKGLPLVAEYLKQFFEHAENADTLTAGTPHTQTHTEPRTEPVAIPTAPTYIGTDLARYNRVTRRAELDSGIYSIALSPDSQLLLMGMTDGTARLVDMTTLEELDIFNRITPKPVSTSGVIAVAFSPDGRLFATSDPWPHFQYDNKFNHLRIRTRTGQLLHTFQVTEGMTGANAIAFSPDSRTVAVSTSQGQAMMWNLETGDRLWTRVVAQGPAPLHMATSVAFSPDGGSLFVGIHEGAVLELDPRTGNQRQRIETEERAFSRVTLSPDGNTMAITNIHGDIRILDRLSGRFLHTVRDGRNNSAFFTGDGSHLVTMGADNSRPIAYFPLNNHENKMWTRNMFSRPSDLQWPSERTVGTMSLDGSFFVLGDMYGNILVVPPRN